MPSSDELSAIQCAALVVLMTEGRDLLNTELVKTFSIKLTPADRDKLIQQGYVKVGKVDGVMTFHMTDAGWARCKRPFDFSKSGARFTGTALTSLLAAVQRDFTLSNRSPAMVFAPEAASGAAVMPLAPSGDSLLEQIRLAYKKFAADKGDWVNIADIRETLSSVGREEMDAALQELEQQRDVNVVPQANEKALSERTRRAAVIIGRQHKHFIAIGV